LLPAKFQEKTMTEQGNELTWAMYQDAWANVTPVERARLLGLSVSVECMFSSPAGEGTGLQELTMMIEAFQVQYPGATFRTHRFLEHHGQALATWTMFDGEGKEFLPGTSYARFDAAGRLVQLAGFWQLQ
jgi:hypothetical protein